jgi:diaminopimelate decarboxylase
MKEKGQLILFPHTAVVADNHLIIGGCDTVELAEEFGTPLYIFDEATLRHKCAEYRDGFSKHFHDSLICYACKAFISRALARIFNEEGLGLDVVSGGELSIAKSTGFPMERVYFNGNNKSRDELETAIDWGVGCIAVDNFHELSMLDELAPGIRDGERTKILIRISPGIDPHTHAHLKTGLIDSKFGFPLPLAEEAITEAMASSSLELAGLHYHIGSQILDLAPFKQAIDLALDFAADMDNKHGFKLKELNIGGGLGIAYTEEQQPPSVDMFAEAIANALKVKCNQLDIQPPRLIVEPGRSITGQAGVAIYTIGAVKDIEGVRKYVSVDGGMGDNIRPALYGAKYQAIVANRVEDQNRERVTVAGKFCESGDILISDIDLPALASGDILAVPCCGAYCLSMASNYNSSLKPAIVLVNDSDARLIQRRETYEDLMRCDMV